jgi:hypothetical protein
VTTHDSGDHQSAAPNRDTRDKRSALGGTPFLHHIIELIEVEVQLVTLRCAKIARDALVQAAIVAVGVLALLVGIIFLYIGIFQVLEKFLRVWQICIIYAVVHLLIGAGLLMVRGTFKRSAQPSTPGDSHVNR